MGAAGSKSPDSETVIHNETAIHFSQDLVNHLSDQMTSPNVTPERQSNLDAHVRVRIQAEMTKLRAEEQEVLLEIQSALEKENLEREKALEGADSASLHHDLEEIGSTVKKFQGRRNLAQDHPEVKVAQEMLLACYRSHPSTTLDCWKEVADFKLAVAKLEQKFIDSLAN